MFDWFVHSFIILLYGFIVFVILFYRYQLKKSLERVESGEGISFYSVRRENDWKAVQPLSRKSKDYLIIHWCAIALPFRNFLDLHPFNLIPMIKDTVNN